MFSKSWLYLIIMLFLGMLIPLILDSLFFDIYEGAIAGGGGSSYGGVGMKKSIATAQAHARAQADAAKLAANPATGDQEEGASDFAELFTVNNDRTNEFAYAYVTESFVEGAAVVVKKAPACKVTSKLILMKEDHKKLKQYINGAMTTWHNKKCK